MMTFRRITVADVEALTALALSAIPYQRTLVVNPDKVRSMVSFFATSHEHFQMAAFDNDKPVAGVAMLVSEMPFHDRCEGTIVFCFSSGVGVGMRLLREMMRWVNNDFRIRRVSWAMNPGFDERMVVVARRLGFQSAHPTLMYCKGA